MNDEVAVLSQDDEAIFGFTVPVPEPPVAPEMCPACGLRKGSFSCESLRARREGGHARKSPEKKAVAHA